MKNILQKDKFKYNWISLIPLPEFVDKDIFIDPRRTVVEKVKTILIPVKKN